MALPRVFAGVRPHDDLKLTCRRLYRRGPVRVSVPRPIKSGLEFEAAFPVKGRILETLLCPDCEAEGYIRIRVARDPKKGWGYDPKAAASYVDIYGLDPRDSYSKARAGEWAEGRVICFGFLKRVRAGRTATMGPVLESGSRLVGAVRVNSKVEIAFGERPLDRLHRGPRLRSERGRKGLRLIKCAARRGEMIQDPQSEGVEGLHLFPAQENLERPRPSNELREPRGGPVTGHPAEVDFRVREDRALIRDAQIAREGELRPRAAGRARDCGDRRLREMFEGPERVLASAHFVLCSFRREPGPFAHVQARTEIRMARPRYDGCANGIVFLQVDDPRREVRDHGDAQEIPGRVVDPKDRHTSLAGDPEPGRIGHQAAMGSGHG